MEQPEVVAEPVEKVSKEEPTEEVSPNIEEVSEEQALTEDDVTQKIGEAEKEWQSRKDKEFQVFQDKILTLEKAASLSSIEAQETREIGDWGDTKEVRDFHSERRKQVDKATDITKREEAVELIASKVALTNQANIANELSVKYGVESKDLLECSSPEEMRVKALEMAFEKARGKLEQVEKAPQKLDSGVKSLPGVDYEKMTAKQLIQAGIDEEKNK